MVVDSLKKSLGKQCVPLFKQRRQCQLFITENKPVASVVFICHNARQAALELNEDLPPTGQSGQRPPSGALARIKTRFRCVYPVDNLPQCTWGDTTSSFNNGTRKAITTKTEGRDSLLSILNTYEQLWWLNT